MAKRQIKAKLKVTSIAKQSWGHPDKQVEVCDLYAVYGQDPGGENYSYSKATPSAHLNIVISNPDAWGFFEGGAEYIVTFEKAYGLGEEPAA